MRRHSTSRAQEQERDDLHALLATLGAFLCFLQQLLVSTVGGLQQKKA
jgi:hypothetical protein